jgi:hypothetical protein
MTVAISEILERVAKGRRPRTYPRAIKKYPQKYPIKRPGQSGQPYHPEIQVIFPAAA